MCPTGSLFKNSTEVPFRTTRTCGTKVMCFWSATGAFAGGSERLARNGVNIDGDVFRRPHALGRHFAFDFPGKTAGVGRPRLNVNTRIIETACKTFVISLLLILELLSCNHFIGPIAPPGLKRIVEPGLKTIESVKRVAVGNWLLPPVVVFKFPLRRLARIRNCTPGLRRLRVLKKSVRLALNSIDHNERRVADHEFARASEATRSPLGGVIRQVLDLPLDLAELIQCGLGIVLPRYVVDRRSPRAPRARRPGQPHQRAVEARRASIAAR